MALAPSVSHQLDLQERAEALPDFGRGEDGALGSLLRCARGGDGERVEVEGDLRVGGRVGRAGGSPALGAAAWSGLVILLTTEDGGLLPHGRMTYLTLPTHLPIWTIPPYNSYCLPSYTTVHCTTYVAVLSPWLCI